MNIRSTTLESACMCLFACLAMVLNVGICAAADLAIVPVAGASDDRSPTPTPSAPPADASPNQTPDHLLSLDELLGLPPEPSPDVSTTSSQPGFSEELKRRLTAQEMGDAFEQAITLMGDAAARMEKNDLSLDTQRLQEDVLNKLDEIIAQIQQQQQQSSSSSSSSKSQQSDKSNNDQSKAGQRSKPKSGKSQQQQQASQGQAGESNAAAQQGALRPKLESNQSQWGNLPQRTRDALQQGQSDKFSSTWQQATENYYRRLAEEAQKNNPNR